MTATLFKRFLVYSSLLANHVKHGWPSPKYSNLEYLGEGNDPNNIGMIKHLSSLCERMDPSMHNDNPLISLVCVSCQISCLVKQEIWQSVLCKK